ncbi:class I SAM-dependent methyltransferase [Thermoflavimicrobium daqui]|jgi:16S rRNA (guanine1207-N2)-methyltransferase|uniref:16S rRNA methyltransferase n=1 Tax=Thermoflavimicrobium daqui TaxID=2137476 RepID=A0A364K328_9BACL|nr:class I SAM-dependent methyltransferase [Thermoflavimicrobium daqui]RAL23239.1 16S rRNA methyltransferase [Thermoflavimicrobium daqui]
MHEHYYSSNPSAKSEERCFQAHLLEHSFTFYTDSGVFSKKGIDFGSRLLIENVSLQQEKTVLDLGAGYGPIGITLARAYPQLSVVMVDINERAIALAKRNAEVNRVIGQVECIVSEGFSELANRSFDMILFNPPIRIGKSAIYELFSEAKSHLVPGGSLWIVIRKKQGAESAKKELERNYDHVEVVAQKKGYWIIQATIY